MRSGICFYFYHSHLSFYGFNRPSMTSLPPSEVFAPTYFHQTSFLTKNKKFPSNKARPSISEFYSSVVTRWCREQAGGTHSSVSFPHFHVSSQSCWTEVQWRNLIIQNVSFHVPNKVTTNSGRDKVFYDDFLSVPETFENSDGTVLFHQVGRGPELIAGKHTSPSQKCA